MTQEESRRATPPDARSRDELILAYAAGELAPEEEAGVEELLAAQPELQETVALYWSLRLLLATNPLQRPGFRATARSRAIFESRVKRTRTQERIRSLARKAVQRVPLVGLAALVILIFVLPFGVTAASETNPGEGLYPVKRSVESLTLALTWNPGRKAEFNLTLANVRVREINELISRKQYHLIEEPLADYEMHLTNAVRGLGAMAGDQPAHLTTASHLEHGLEKIRTALDPVMESTPPEVRANVTQLLNRADVAEAFLKADKQLVLESSPSSLQDSEPEAQAEPLEPVETLAPPAARVETLPPAKDTLPVIGISDVETPPPDTVRSADTAVTAPATVPRVEDSSTATPVAATETPTTLVELPTATVSHSPTVGSTLAPTTEITPTAAIEITVSPTPVETPVPSATLTAVVPSATPFPTVPETASAPTGTAVPEMTATEIPPTAASTATDAPISTATPAAPDTPATEGPRKTPNLPKPTP